MPADGVLSRTPARSTTWLLVGWLLALAASGSAFAQSPVRGSGTVDTVAGPGFCAGPTLIDATPPRIGGLAFDDRGRLFADVLDRQRGPLVRMVEGSISTAVRSDAPLPPVVSNPPDIASGPPSDSRMGASGRGGVLLATGSSVLEIIANPPSVTTLAGAPAGSVGERVPSSTGDGGPITHARFTSARSVAVDSAGNVFVADMIDPGTAVFRIRFLNRTNVPVTFYTGTPDELTVAPGSIETVAGTGSEVNSHEGASARRATLRGVPPALVVLGNRLYVAATSFGGGPRQQVASIWLINLGGEPVTAHGMTIGAGSMQSVALESADAAEKSYISSIDIDAEDNLYLAEPGRSQVRRVDAAGTISTLAGNGETGEDGLGDAGLDRPATQAPIGRPVDVTAASGGRIFIVDANRGRILYVDPRGMIHLALGNERPTHCGPRADPATGSPIPDRPDPGEPYSLAVGSDGGVFFVNGRTQRVMKRDPSGTTFTHVASPSDCEASSICDSEEMLVAPSLRWPAATARSADGLYLYDFLGAQVLYENFGSDTSHVHGVTVPPGEARVVVGTGSAGAKGDGGPAIQAELSGQGSIGGPQTSLSTVASFENAVGDIATDTTGNLFIADAGNGHVRKVDTAGMITTIAGRGGPPGRQTCCTEPAGLAVDPFGNLYVSDLATRHVWLLNEGAVAVTAHGQKVAPGEAAPVAGTGSRGVSGDGVALEQPLRAPIGLVADGQGNVFIADYRDHTVRRVDRAGQLTTVVGTGAGGFNGDGLPARQTSLWFPTDVDLDRCGNLLIADYRNDRIRRVNLGAPCDIEAGPQKDLKASNRWPLWMVLAGAGLAIVGGAGADRLRRP